MTDYHSMHGDQIQTESEYDAALSRVSDLVSLDPAIGTKDSNELLELSARVDRYECEYFPFPGPTPAEAIQFRIEQLGTADAVIREYIGEPEVVVAILSGQQPLSDAMIQRIHHGLQIPLDILRGDRCPQR